MNYCETLVSQPVMVARSRKQFGRVLADRLEHPVAPVGEAQQALLDQRLQGVEFGVGNLLRRLQRAAAGEDRQAGEELLLLG